MKNNIIVCLVLKYVRGLRFDPGLGPQPFNITFLTFIFFLKVIGRDRDKLNKEFLFNNIILFKAL